MPRKGQRILILNLNLRILSLNLTGLISNGNEIENRAKKTALVSPIYAFIKQCSIRNLSL